MNTCTVKEWQGPAAIKNEEIKMRKPIDYKAYAASMLIAQVMPLEHDAKQIGNNVQGMAQQAIMRFGVTMEKGM